MIATESETPDHVAARPRGIAAGPPGDAAGETLGGAGRRAAAGQRPPDDVTKETPGDARGDLGGAGVETRVRVVGALGEDLDAGFAVLYDAYRTVVFSTALRVSGRWADAEDLAAETFLRAYRALVGYPPERVAALTPRAWLLTILLNVWRNDRRTLARHPTPAPLETAPDTDDGAEPVDRTAERNETGRELADLLALLPEDQRVAVVLRHVDDLPVAEIAQVLGCPVGTAKSHISRGLRRLRELHAARPSELPASSEVPHA